MAHFSLANKKFKEKESWEGGRGKVEYRVSERWEEENVFLNVKVMRWFWFFFVNFIEEKLNKNFWSNTGILQKVINTVKVEFHRKNAPIIWTLFEDRTSAKRDAKSTPNLSASSVNHDNK